MRDTALYLVGSVHLLHVISNLGNHVPIDPHERSTTSRRQEATPPPSIGHVPLSTRAYKACQNRSGGAVQRCLRQEGQAQRYFRPAAPI